MQVHESFVWGQDPDQWTWSSSFRNKQTLKCTYLAVISFSLTEAVAVEDWGEFGIVMK